MDNLTIQFLQPREVALLQQEPTVASAKQFNLTYGSGHVAYHLTVNRELLGQWLVRKGYGSRDLRLLPVAQGKLWANVINKGFLRQVKQLGGSGCTTHFEFTSPICEVYMAEQHKADDGPALQLSHHHNTTADTTSSSYNEEEQRAKEKQKNQQALEEAEQLRLARLNQQRALEAETEERKKQQEKKQKELRRQRIRVRNEQVRTQATHYAPRRRQLQDDGPDL